jgi:hypothetical protein
MKPYILKLLLPVCIAAIIPACKKDKTPDAGGNTLDKITRQFSNQPGVTTTTQYQYDGNNRLVLVTIVYAANNVDSTRFTYDAGGKLTGYTLSTTQIGGIASYAMQYDNNGRIVRAKGTPIMFNLQVDDHTFAYDAQGRLAADSQVYQQTNKPFNYHIYTYNADNNIIKDEQFDNSSGSFQLIGTTTATYDGHTNPLYSNGMALYTVFQDRTMLSKYNTSSETGQSAGSSSPYGASTSFDYYSNGLVRRAVITPVAGGVTTAEYYFKAP